MRDEQHSGVIGLVMVAVLAGYLGTYFLVADYLDIGSNTPTYLVRYRAGSVSLHWFAPFFEPARQLDDFCLRRRKGVLIEWCTP